VSLENYWLLKSEPSTYAWKDLERQENQSDLWDGIRNYQARNLIKTMKTGEFAFFYHSSTKEPEITGIVEIIKEAYPDPSQFDPESKYFFAKSSREKPIWFSVDVRIKEKLKKTIKLKVLRKIAQDGDLVIGSLDLLKKGNRLSVQKLSKIQWKTILQLAK